jgi:hypothetical protein
MEPSLAPAAAAFGTALRALDRALSDSRGQWDDAARQVFDRRFADPIRADGAKAARELERAAEELTVAARTLQTLG